MFAELKYLLDILETAENISAFLNVSETYFKYLRYLDR